MLAHSSNSSITFLSFIDDKNTHILSSIDDENDDL